MEKAHLKSVKSVPRPRFYVFVAMTGLAGLLLLLVAFATAPWLYAMNTTVRLHLEAPASTKLSICWDGSQSQCLPLVPYSQAQKAIPAAGQPADVWLSELPARPDYNITVQFNSYVHAAIFRDLELDSSQLLQDGWNPRYDLGVADTRFGIDDFRPTGISQSGTGVLSLPDSTQTRTLELKQRVQPGPLRVLRSWGVALIWAGLMLLYLCAASVLYFLPGAKAHLGSRHPRPEKAGYPWWVYTLCGMAGAFMILLVTEAGVLLHQYDPMSYLFLATDGQWFNVSRLLGYPVFLRMALVASGYVLNGVPFWQALLLVLAVFSCTWVLRRWLSPSAAVVFVLLSLLSPFQLLLARWILRESLFGSLVLAGVAAAIAHLTTSKPTSSIWLGVFAIICGLAFLVRENGVILPLALLPPLLLEAAGYVLGPGTGRERLRLLGAPLVRFAIPVGVVAAVYLGFSAHNYAQFGYFQLEEQQTSHGSLARLLNNGIFDARGLLGPVGTMSKEAKSYLGKPLYSYYVVARHEHSDDDQTYVTFYPFLSHRMTLRRAPTEDLNPFHQADLINRIGANIGKLVPRKAVFIGALRQYFFALDSAPRGSQCESFCVMDSPENNRALLAALPITVTLAPSPRLAGVNSVVGAYDWLVQRSIWYSALFGLALIASFYVLASADPAFLAPITVYVANCALALHSSTIATRYVANLDFLLTLQVALALTCWMTHRSLRRESQQRANGFVSS